MISRGAFLAQLLAQQMAQAITSREERPSETGFSCSERTHEYQVLAALNSARPMYKHPIHTFQVLSILCSD